MRDPYAFGAEVFEHLRHGLDPLPRERADHLALDAGRIGKRSEQIENGAGAELDARRADILHRRMMRGREHEADAGLLDAVTNMFGRELNLHAQRTEHVGCARARGERAIAVLGHRHAGACHDERSTGRNVERARSITAGADHVDGVCGRDHLKHLGTHGGDGAGDLIAAKDLSCAMSIFINYNVIK